MTKKRDYLTLTTIVLLIVTSMAGILSIDFTKSYEIVNQYGHIVEMYGYGIYAYDTYFQAPISIGTDICGLLVGVPMFIHSYISDSKNSNTVTKLGLIGMYACAFYYAASICFGLTYNRLFLVYVALFSCSLFGMFTQIGKLKLTKTVSITKGLGIFLILSGIALIVAWLPDVIPSMINGGTLSLIGVYTTNITYVLDMGIISPICFLIVYLLKRKNPLGTLLLAILLKLCMLVGIMMFPQTICQELSGCEIPLPALVTKSFSFVLLGAFAIYFYHKMKKEIRKMGEE